MQRAYIHGLPLLEVYLQSIFHGQVRPVSLLVVDTWCRHLKLIQGVEFVFQGLEMNEFS